MTATMTHNTMTARDESTLLFATSAGGGIRVEHSLESVWAISLTPDRDTDSPPERATLIAAARILGREIRDNEWARFLAGSFACTNHYNDFSEASEVYSLLCHELIPPKDE